MAGENNSGTSAGDALDMAIGTAVAAALVNDGVDKPVDLAALPPNCLNCGAVVRGRFCVDCGQTTDTHVPTLAEVAGDAIVSIFNLDSRLWRTVTTLFFKPGMLTREFLAGRRARYVPPLRLYLVLSVLTFLVLSFPDGIDDDADEVIDGTQLTQEQEDAIEDAPNAAARAAAINDAVNAQVGAALENVPGISAEMREDLATRAAAEAAAEAANDPDPNLDLSRGVDLDLDDDGQLTVGDAEGNRVKIGSDFDCAGMDLPFERGGAVDSALRETCEDGKADNFDSLMDAFRDNIPLLAFAVIPVMAVVFKLFYAFSRRNYLAHLVFLCHTHAFTFLLFIVLTAMRYAGQVVPALSSTMSVLGAFLFLLYPSVYYFLAMRRVYEQGRALTLLKEFLLMIVYLFAVMLVFSVGFIVVALAN
jgi:hypothetical protein